MSLSGEPQGVKSSPMTTEWVGQHLNYIEKFKAQEYDFKDLAWIYYEIKCGCL